MTDAAGHARHLEVNGRPVFVKAVNYIPWQHFAEVGRAFYDRDMRLIAEAHGNSIGVHAHVQSPHAYDAADAAGVLTFQDFPLQWFYDSGTETQPGVRRGGATPDRGHGVPAPRASERRLLRVSQRAAADVRADAARGRHPGAGRRRASPRRRAVRDAAVDRRFTSRARGVGHRRRRPLVLGLADRSEPLPRLRAAGLVRERVRVLDRRSAGRRSSATAAGRRRPSRCASG